MATNQQVLNFEQQKGNNLVSNGAEIVDSIVIQPCFIGKGTIIKKSVIGPHVSIGENTKIDDSRISNSIVQHDTSISCMTLKDSMLGSHVTAKGKCQDLSLGDYTEMGDAN